MLSKPFGAGPDPREIDDATAVEAWRTGSAVLVDVREPEEFASGHIPGAVPIPLGELARRSHELPKGTRIITVCRSGKRSLHAVDILTAQEWADVKSTAGGMIAWKRANREIAS